MNNLLLGAIVGDIFGQPYEFKKSRQNSPCFDLFKNKGKFTDDTVCTIGVAEAIIHNPKNPDFTTFVSKWCSKYSYAGYGKLFKKWIVSDKKEPYGSYSNGSAMRVSPCGYLYEYEDVLYFSTKQAEITHNHKKGIIGANCVADLIWSAREGYTKKELTDIASEYYPNYDFDAPIEKVRKGYTFDSSCEGSVPQAIRCFLESTSYESCIRNAIYLGGDADTIGAISGSIAYAYWKEMNEDMKDYALEILPKEMIKVINDFDNFIKQQ